MNTKRNIINKSFAAVTRWIFAFILSCVRLLSASSLLCWFIVTTLREHPRNQANLSRKKATQINKSEDQRNQANMVQKGSKSTNSLFSIPAFPCIGCRQWLHSFSRISHDHDRYTTSCDMSLTCPIRSHKARLLAGCTLETFFIQL